LLEAPYFVLQLCWNTGKRTSYLMIVWLINYCYEKLDVVFISQNLGIGLKTLISNKLSLRHSFIPSVTGWRLPSIRHLLLEVMEKVISRLKESTNDKHRSCYYSSRYCFRYVAFTSRTPSPLKLRPRDRTDRCVSSIMVLAVEKRLHQYQHQEDH